MRYRFGKTVTYVTSSGTVLDEDAVRTRIKVGVPVRVHMLRARATTRWSIESSSKTKTTIKHQLS